MKNLKHSKEDLVAAIKQSQELSDEQKADIIELIRIQKKYGLVWEDSPELAEQELKNKLPILREVEDRRINNDTGSEHYPNHILIEGENLQALIALTYTHAGRVDVIYIDPPYNTGNKDFVYNDSFIGEDDEYRHSKWLSFMEKRLKIAKTLLSERGVIFISIDDNEQANLKLLCDSIFGEKCFIANLVWQKKFSRANDALYFSTMHDHILCYCKKTIMDSQDGWKIGLLPRQSDCPKGYSNPDNDPRGPWTSTIMSAKSGSSSLLYEIVTPSGRIVTPPNGRYWSCSKDTFEQWKTEKRIWFGKNGDGAPRKKTFLSEVQEGLRPNTLILQEEGGNNQEGKQELKSIMNGEGIFDGPKPTKLIKLLLRIANGKCNTILDFFAGSGTTLHATMQLNSEDGGHRRCILITNNENGICENVTYERNKRVIQGYKTPKGENVAGLTHNNLRYYQIKAVPRDNSIRSRMKLAAGSVNMLCIMENLYHERDRFGNKGNFKALRYFEEGGRGMLVILDTDMIPNVVEQLKRMQPQYPIHIYMYAPGDYAFDDEFEEVANKVELFPLPQPILNAYKNWLPKQDEILLDVPDNYEMSDAELKESAKDFISKED